MKFQKLLEAKYQEPARSKTKHGFESSIGFDSAVVIAQSTLRFQSKAVGRDLLLYSRKPSLASLS